MHIFAHRGVSAHLPENTRAAFARAVELGVEGIELDVQLSADNVPVVIHDDTADRTTNGTGHISEFTAHQLGLLDAGAGEHVPTLAQILSLAAGQLRVNIELKDAAAVPAVVRVLEEITAENSELDWFASSADWAALVELRQLRPNAAIYPLCVGNLDKLRTVPSGQGAVEFFAGRGLQAAIDFGRASGAEGVSVWSQGLDRDDILEIHDAGLQAWVWTVNDSIRAQELLALGADAICTDDPELLQGALRVAPPAILDSAVLG